LLLCIQCAQVAAAPGQQQVGQGGARLGIEAAARLLRAQHFGGRHARQLLAGAVPDHHLALHVEHESRHDQQFHHLDGESLGFANCCAAGCCVTVRHVGILV